MEKVQFSVQINAPVHLVWTTMLEDASYREWTSAFQEGSYFDGSWTMHGVLRFLAPDATGAPSGLIGRVVEKRTDEFVSVEYIGQVVDGVDDTESERARSLAGMRENYSFSEENGVTTVTVDQDTSGEMAAMLEDAWPKSLAALKELAEE